MSFLISRRRFCVTAASTVAGAMACRQANSTPVGPEPSRLEARPSAPTSLASPGTYRLGLGGARDGFLYIPPNPTRRLIVLLHGAGQSSFEWSRAPLDALFGSRGIVALVPDSRGTSWDVARGGYGPDVRFLDRALEHTYERCDIDPGTIALAGFSDGASYALSLGITNGDLFSHLMAFSPGFLAPTAHRGKPRIFVAHGTSDQILDIDRTSRVIVPKLRSSGYDVTYVEFDGRHAIMVPVVTQAVEWFTVDKPAPVKQP